ncbi:11141_t:CDS:2 [Entrophospora sp. SA101]|nr:11141_t:CDS:2 [Entrophospora sp. SA101]
MESSIDLGLPVTKDTNPSNNSSQNSIKSTEKPIGRRVSGKPWKYQKTATRRSQLPKVLRKSWTERMKEKNERIAVKLLENELKDKVESEKKSNFNFNGNNNNKNYANNTTMKDNHPSYSNNISTYYTINNNALTDSNDNYNGNFTGAYHHNYRGGKFNDSVSIGIAHPPSPGAPNYQNNILRKNLLKEFPLNKYTVDEAAENSGQIILCNKACGDQNIYNVKKRSSHQGDCGSCKEVSNKSLVCKCGSITFHSPVPCGTTLPPCPYNCESIGYIKKWNNHNNGYTNNYTNSNSSNSNKSISGGGSNNVIGGNINIHSD